MKVIAISIIAFAIIAVSVVAAAAVRKTAPQRAMAEEPCVGLSCWPASLARRSSADRRIAKVSSRFGDGTGVPAHH